MRYEVIFTEAARRLLRDLPVHIQKRVKRWIDLLAEDPRRTGTRQLAGHPDIRRVHASKDYVILYTIEKERVAIVVLRVETDGTYIAACSNAGCRQTFERHRTSHPSLHDYSRRIAKP